MKKTLMAGFLALGLLAAMGCGDTDDTADQGTVNNDVNNGFTNNDPNNDAPNNDVNNDVNNDAPNNDPNNDVNNDAPNNDQACPRPMEPFGTSEGSRFFPLTLEDCDREPFDVYSEEGGFCEAKLTVVSIAAGWCGPCRVEAELMQEKLVEAFEDQGVRILVAIIQDNDFRPPTHQFCKTWKAQYGLTNTVMIDPLQETNIYFPEGALPSTLIFDNQGVIVHREYGVSDELTTVRARIEQLLAEME